jgi:ABC-2 type transport system ATP-binding protein
VLDVVDLTKRFGTTVALDGLGFSVAGGTITGLVGPNGAGKTTTVRALLGLVRPDSGAATIDGRAYRELERPAHAVGAVLESPRFHPGRSGRDHLRVLAAAARIAASRVDEVLALVELQGVARRRVGGWSPGLRQRLALAAALLGDPPVLVLDDPASGLDPQGVAWLRDFLRSLRGEGRTILAAGHARAEIVDTVDEVVVIDCGRLVASGAAAELALRGGVRVRTPEPERLRAALAAEALAVRAQDGVLSVAGATPARIGELAAALGIVLHELAAETAWLVDVQK